MGNERLEVRDIREAPFCWQEKAALRLIRSKIKPSEAPVAGYVYVALTELASNKETNQFKVKRMTLAEMVSRSGNIVDGYLNQLVELGLIEKSPVVIEGEYRCMNIRLLPCPLGVQSVAPLPTGEVSLPTGTPPSTLPTETPVPAHEETSPCPQGNSSEESSSEKNLHPRKPGATSAPDSSASTPSTAPASPGAKETTSTTERVSPATAHPGCSGPAASRRAGAGVVVPGGGGRPDWEVPPARKEKTPKAKDLHTILPAEKWGARDAIGYFGAQFRRKWPMEGPPDFTYKKDIPAINSRIAWLKKEGMDPTLLKQVIDHLFNLWDSGLPARLGWKGGRPGLAFIESVKWFETLVREVQQGAPKVRKDEYDEKKAKDFPVAGWQ